MKRRGLTLVELIVVISIMTLLLSALLPTLRTARERIRATVCGAKIKQLLLGLQSYEAAYGTFPPGFQNVGCPAAPGPYAGNHSMDLVGFWWFDFSQEVDYRCGDGLELLMCPSKRQRDRWLEVNILAGNYGVNLAICRLKDYFIKPYSDEFSGVSLSSADVAQPGATLLLVDSGYSLICWWMASPDPPVTFPLKPWLQNTCYVPGMALNKDKGLWPGQTEDAVGGRHPQKTVNVGFVDGHVDRKRADELSVDEIGEGQWNFSPLWQPRRNPVTVRNTSP